MSCYPCPRPDICGVAYHRDPRNCRGARQSSKPASLPTPSLTASSHAAAYQAERTAFEAQGGEIKEEWYENGQKEREIWFLNGKEHREDGPAVQMWGSDGQKWYEVWLLNGKRHREDGPAKQEWRHSGKKKVEEWYLNGKFHREDGPSQQGWYEDGSLRDRSWHLNGEPLSEDQFEAHLLAKETGMPYEWAIETIGDSWD